MNLTSLAAGLGAWSLLEYTLHRFVLHGPLLQLHLPHHRHPTGQGFDWKPSFVAGLLTGYVAYSYLHARLHHGAGFGKLKEFHDLHHDQPNRNFGVTQSFWDRVFGTLAA